MPRVARATSGSRVEEFGVRRKTTLKNGKGCKNKKSMVKLKNSIKNKNSIEKPRAGLTRDYDKKRSKTKKESSNNR